MDINESKRVEEELQKANEALVCSEQNLRLRLDSIFSPEKELEEDLTLTELFDLDYLQELQDAFALANDVASAITDLDGNLITKLSNSNTVCQLIRSTPEGKKRCSLSDKKLGEKSQSLMRPNFQQCLSCGFI